MHQTFRSYSFANRETLTSTLLTLQIANPSSAQLNPDSKEALLLQSTLRMILENLRMSTYLLQEVTASGISVMALCALSRAASILVRLCGRELSNEDLEMLRANLLRFSARWSICRTYAVCLFL